MTLHQLPPVVKHAAYLAKDLVWYTAPAFVTVWLLERLTGARTDQYRTRNCLHDLGWWTYNRCLESGYLAPVLIATLLSGKLAFLNFHVADKLPTVPRFLVVFMAMDLLRYWFHRGLHSNALLWSFHTTHHSQRVMTFMTSSRSHPVENFLYLPLNTVLIAVLGSPPQLWLPLNFLAVEVPDFLHHSQVSWRFGRWLSRFLVSPAFHSLHHSRRTEHYNRNFGTIFSCWDFLFGTAVDAPRAAEFGIDGIEMPTVRSQLLLPFKLAWRELLRTARRERSRAAVEVTTSQDFPVSAIGRNE